MLPTFARLAAQQVERARGQLDAAAFEALSRAAAQAEHSGRREREPQHLAVLRPVAVPADARSGIVAGQQRLDERRRVAPGLRCEHGAQRLDPIRQRRGVGRAAALVVVGRAVVRGQPLAAPLPEAERFERGGVDMRRDRALDLRVDRVFDEQHPRRRRFGGEEVDLAGHGAYMGAMPHHATTLAFDTQGPGLSEITREVAAWLASTAIEAGLLTAFCRHTSASLLITENAAHAVRGDLLRWLDRLAPQGAHYEHDHEGPDDMPAHLKAALTGASQSIPVIHGRLALGTWQGLFLVEHRARPHRREVALHIAGD